jgi:hypothetical protein
MFSKRSSSSISLATETPSLVMVGAPKLFSMHHVTAFRAQGRFYCVSQDVDAGEHFLAAESPNLTSLAAIIDIP